MASWNNSHTLSNITTMKKLPPYFNFARKPQHVAPIRSAMFGFSYNGWDDDGTDVTPASKESEKETEKEKAYMIDIDGVVCEDCPNEFPELMITTREIPGAREWVNSKYDAGAYICFFTARTQEHKEITEDWLRSHGFKFHQIIFGKPRHRKYHYIDNIGICATTFRGKFTPLVTKSTAIEVFDD
jgi:hypothetical protein